MVSWLSSFLGCCFLSREETEEIKEEKDFYYSHHHGHQQQQKRRKNKNNNRKKIPVEVRNDVWEAQFGISKIGHCYCCSKEITRYGAGWDCSHILADKLGGLPEVKNLKPCCKHCNRSMGTKNLYIYIIDQKLDQGQGRKDLNDIIERVNQKKDTRFICWTCSREVLMENKSFIEHYTGHELHEETLEPLLVP